MCVCVQRINEHKHMCDKVEAHEANVLDFCGSHGCQVERDLLGHVRRTGYIIVYTELSDHGGLKLFILTLYNLFYNIGNFSKSSRFNGSHTEIYTDLKDEAKAFKISINFCVALKHFLYSFLYNNLDLVFHHYSFFSGMF